MGTIFTTRNGNLKVEVNRKSRKRRKEYSERTRLTETLGHGQFRNDMMPQQTVELRAVDSLKPAKHRIHKQSTAQVTRLVKGIKRFGFRGAILVKGDTIVDGHARVEAAKQLGLTHIPCMPVDDLSPSEIEAFKIGSQEIAKQAVYDIDVLKLVVQDVILVEDLGLLNLDTVVIDALLSDEPEAIAADHEDEIPDISVTPVSRPGDLFELGVHRVLCGDACDKQSYDTLLGELLARAVITDEPYNVKIAGNVSGLGKKKHKEFTQFSGEATEEEFFDANVKWFEFWRDSSQPCSAIATFIDFRSVATVIVAAKKAGLKMLNMAVWDKGTGAMGSYLRSQHELIPVFCNGDALACNNVMLGKHGRDRSNVWRYPGANTPGSSAAKALKDHPTPKNVAMIEDAIIDITMQNDIVLDPFLGSGTTIIAAERTARRCYGLELDPQYVDVCISRWEAETGGTAIHASSGLTFAELGEKRLAPGDEPD